MAFLVGKVVEVKGLIQGLSLDEQDTNLIQKNSELFYKDTLIIPTGSTLTFKLVNGQLIQLVGKDSLYLDETVVPYHYLDNLSATDIHVFELILQRFLEEGVEETLADLTNLTSEQSTILKRIVDAFIQFEEQTNNQDSSSQQVDSFFGSSSQQGSFQERLGLEGQVVSGFETGTGNGSIERLYEYFGEIDRVNSS